ncbi:hypothetical protein [Lacipirellula parvula]|uniref:Uncharacterized protein n=1 Tax=Lacipirellula parvula TaxID=2650471 RepID=A0A5K7XA22_9BACT|nr:hypothetical protein [Lacipirellula parvula]BBO31273.1 hypothetical protein PLANPX_0885 [Lacipirellula parvula]
MLTSAGRAHAHAPADKRREYGEKAEGRQRKLAADASSLQQRSDSRQ